MWFWLSPPALLIAAFYTEKVFDWITLMKKKLSPSTYLYIMFFSLQTKY